jgi:hypothetical protein
LKSKSKDINGVLKMASRKDTFLKNVFLLVVLVSAGMSSADGLSLKGGNLRCDQPDGQEVRVAGITDTKDLSRLSIRCLCQRGVVRCERQVNSCSAQLQGCHYLEDVEDKPWSCSQACRGCLVNGTKHDSGRSWQEGESFRECFSGVLTTTPSISCPAPMCLNPEPAKEGACPSCPGCSRAGAVFAEGETKPDITDPCNQCSCADGKLTCIRKSCPVLPCAPRLVKKVAGQCCPVCARAEPAFANIAKLNMCLFRGQVYSPGQMVKPDSCTHCICSESLTLECDRRICPELLCPLANQRRASGECCPYCLNSIEQTQLPALRPAVTEQTNNIVGCTHKGAAYSVGKTWQDGCSRCTCNDSGKAVCTMPDCPDNCPSGMALVPKAGQCCPQCELKEGVCTVFGDPHYKTFDGRIFNFQGSCKYLLAQDCEKKANSSFSIRITNDARRSTAFSWTRYPFYKTAFRMKLFCVIFHIRNRR